MARFDSTVVRAWPGWPWTYWKKKETAPTEKTRVKKLQVVVKVYIPFTHLVFYMLWECGGLGDERQLPLTGLEGGFPVDGLPSWTVHLTFAQATSRSFKYLKVYTSWRWYWLSNQTFGKVRYALDALLHSADGTMVHRLFFWGWGGSTLFLYDSEVPVGQLHLDHASIAENEPMQRVTRQPFKTLLVWMLGQFTSSVL